MGETQMNAKIKNYVEVLFSDIPKTRKSQELKEEILSNLMDRFNGYLSDGKSENEAYTLAVTDLGDVDEMLKSIVPEKEIKEKIDSYRKLRARNTSIAVCMYILGAAFLILFSCLSEMLNMEELGAIIGLVGLLVLVAGATGILIYTNMSIPQEIEPYINPSKEDEFDKTTRSGEILDSILKLFWMLVTIIYLAFSFSTGRWDFSWIIWLIAVAIKQAIIAIYNMCKK